MIPDLTIDRESLRKRFAGAIIGIRGDGTQAVLVPFQYGETSYFDLVTGKAYYGLVENFPTIIRPGDIADLFISFWSGGAPNGKISPPRRATYMGISFSHRYGLQFLDQFGDIYDIICPVAEEEPATDSEATVDEAALARLWKRGKEAWKNIGPSASAWVDEMRGNVVEPEGEVPTLKPCIVCNGKADETRVYDTHCLNTQCPLYAISMSKEKWNARHIAAMNLPTQEEFEELMRKGEEAARSSEERFHAVRHPEPMNYGAAALLRQAQEEIHRHKPADGPRPEDYESCPKCKSSFSFCRPFSDGVCPKCGHSLLGTAVAPEPALGIALTREQVAKLELAYLNSSVVATHRQGLEILQEAVQEIIYASAPAPEPTREQKAVEFVERMVSVVTTKGLQLPLAHSMLMEIAIEAADQEAQSGTQKATST